MKVKIEKTKKIKFKEVDFFAGEKATHLTSTEWGNSGRNIHEIKSIKFDRDSRESEPLVTEFEVYLYHGGEESTKYAQFTEDFSKSLVFYDQVEEDEDSVVLQLTRQEAANLKYVLGNFAKCPVAGHVGTFDDSLYQQLNKLGIITKQTTIQKLVDRTNKEVDYLRVVLKQQD